MERLQELLGHVRRCHSATQIHHFIVVKGGAFCDYGALRQALRETHTRVGVVKELLLQIAEAELDVSDLEEREDAESRLVSIERFGAEAVYDPRRREIELTRARTKLSALQDDLTERAYELSHFYAVACAIKDKVEADRGMLTPELHAKLDSEMWTQRLLLDVAHELRMDGKVHTSTLQLIESLPRQQRQTMLDDISDPMKLMEWASQVDYNIPEIKHVLSGEEVIKYVADADSPRPRLREPDHAPAC